MKRSAMTPVVKGALAGAGVGAVIAATMLGDTRIGDLKLFELAELTTIDRRFHLASVDSPWNPFHRAHAHTAGLVVVAVDENAVLRLEKERISWPFPRSVWDELIGTIDRLGPRAIVVDVVFSDARETLSRRDDPFAACALGDAGCADPNGTNRSFGGTLHGAGNVVVAANVLDILDDIGANRARGWHPAIAAHLASATVPVEGDAPVYPADEGAVATVLRLPEANIMAGVRALGVVNYLHQLDADFKIRRVAPAMKIGTETHADLGFAALSVALAPRRTEPPPLWEMGRLPPLPGHRPPLTPVRLSKRAVSVGDRHAPLDETGAVWIDWRGAWLRDPILERNVVSAQKIIDARDEVLLAPADGPPPAIAGVDMRDKIVLIGLTLQGEFSDNVSTPFGTQAGVFKHAATIDTLLGGTALYRMPRSIGRLVTLLLSAICGALVLGLPQYRWQAAGVPLIQALGALVPGIALMLAYAVGAGFAFRAGWILDLAHVSLAMAGTILLCFSLRFREEEAKKKEAHGHLRRAFGPEIANKVIAEGDPTLGGARFHLTLFFSDIAGFTTISEKLSPEELVTVLNEYLTRVTDLFVTRHAVLDKYIGDAIMAYWGAPIPDPEGPVRACLAAIDAMAVIDAYSAELEARGLSPLRTRIGINTGFAVAGWVGHPERKSPTVLGDTVNLAARLEGANKAYGTTCILGEETYALAKHAIVARELDLVKVKGKHIPVRVYELMGRAGEVDEARLAVKTAYEATLARYRGKDFAGALAALETLAANGDGPSAALARNCRERMETPPPPDWDGSNVLHEK